MTLRLSRRVLAAVFGPFSAPVSLNRRAMRRPLEFLALEERVVPSLASPPDQSLLTSATSLSVHSADLDFDGRNDLISLGRGGLLTTARNRGDNTWTERTTIELQRPTATGLEVGSTDLDPYPDLVIQTPGGVTIASGDGTGRFGQFRDFVLGTAGAFASPSSLAVDPILTPIGSNPFASIVAVAPGTNEVAVLKRTLDGKSFDPVVQYASGGLTPTAVVAGQFVGDDRADLAIGHQDGTVTFLEGQADGTFVLRSSLTVTGLGAVTGLAATDTNGDGELDIVVSGTDRVTVLRNATDVLRSEVLVNGDFSRGLTGWTVESGNVTAGGAFAQFRESDSRLLSTLQQSFVVPATATTLDFDLTEQSLEALAGQTPDAFEVSLLGRDGLPLVPSFRGDATSFFNLNPGKTVGVGSGVSFDGRRVSLSLAGIATGTKATVIFDLIGNQSGLISTVSIDNVSVGSTTARVDGFTSVPLAGPFASATSVAAGDVTGDGVTDIVVPNGSGLLLFEGNGSGGFARSVYTPPNAGNQAVTVAVAPLTAGDTTADVILGFTDSGKVATPLSWDGGPGLDQAPRLATLPSLTGVEGTAVSLLGTFRDPDGSASYTADIHWGDGSTSPGIVTFASGSGTVQASHTYADNGSYTVGVTVRSAGTGPRDFQSTIATISNVAPSAAVSDLNGNFGGFDGSHSGHVFGPWLHPGGLPHARNLPGPHRLGQW
jgi:FG-GAP-like repeat/PKD domain/FG-GAP repeat